MIVIIVNVPDRPSTPSAQLVTLIEIQISAIERTAKTGAGIEKLDPVSARVI